MAARYAFSSDEMTVRTAMPFTKNDSSVVLLISAGDLHILLGGDLENDSSPARGWNSVLGCQTIQGKKASAFKVSHHGSSNGYDPRVWNNLLEVDTQATIAPWGLAGRELPQEEDIDRLLNHTSNLHVTALPSGGKSIPRGSIVQSELRIKGIKGTATYKSVGQVRLRRGVTATHPWQVALVQPACSGQVYLKHLQASPELRD